MEDDVKDVQQEIALLSQLAQADVQNVTKYHGSYLNGSNLWIIMDYCSGGSISTLLKAGIIEERYSSVIMREVLIALQYIHKEGIIHRDIKAANILVTKEGHVQLCDFGVAAQLSTAQLKRTSMIGTPYWMAPEVIQEGHAYNQKADVWSLGITLYEITTGTPPYADQEARRAIQLIPRAKPARLDGTQYSVALKEFVAKCLDEQPEERTTAEELTRTRFIKNTKSVPTFILRDLIIRYTQWRAKNTGIRDSFLMPHHGGATIGSDDEDEDEGSSEFWDFGDSTALQTSNLAPSVSHPFQNVSNSVEPSIPGNQMGTLMAGSSLHFSPPTVAMSNHNVDGTGSQLSTFRPVGSAAPDQMTIDSEKHPLMELFETEESKLEAAQKLASLISMPNASTSKLTGMSQLAPMPEFTSQMISLDLPTAPYTPTVEIQIPSFDAIDSHRITGPSSAGLPLPQLTLSASSASTSNLPDLDKSKTRMGMSLMGTPAVTPHTPIKTVFSQTNLSQSFNSGQHFNYGQPVASTHYPTSLNPGPPTRRSTSPNVGINKSARSSPSVPSGHQHTLSGSRIPSQGSLRTLVAWENSSEVEEPSSFGSNPKTRDKALRPLGSPLSRTSSSTVIESQMQIQNELFMKQIPKPIRKMSSPVTTGSSLTGNSVYLAMPSPSFVGVKPISLQPVPSPKSHGNRLANSSIRDSTKDQSIEAQKQLQYNQQLMLQQQKQGSSGLAEAPTLGAQLSSRALGPQKAFIPKQVLKQKTLQIPQDQGKPRTPGSATDSISPNTSVAQKFPRLMNLDSNMLLDSASKNDVVSHLDSLFVNFLSSLDAIEQELNNYL